MKLLFLTILSFSLLTLKLNGQDITDVDRHPGYGGIYVGDYYDDVKKILLKDSITLKQTWDTTDSRAQIAERIYLADVSQADLDSFQGRKVERIEVYMSQRHNNSIEDPNDHRQVVDYIKIYLQQEHYDSGAFQDLVGYLNMEYGAYYEEYDYPEPGDMRYSWSGRYLTCRLSNYIGESPINRKFDLATYYRSYE